MSLLREGIHRNRPGDIIDIGSTLKIVQAENGTSSTNNKIQLVSQADATYKDICIDTNGDLCYDGNPILNTTNIESDLADKEISMQHIDLGQNTEDFTYINFVSSGGGSGFDGVRANGIGLRLNNSGIMQFKNLSGSWTNIGSGGGGGASNLSDLSDVNVSSPVSNQLLVYNNSNSRFENATNITLPGTLTLPASNNLNFSTSNIQFNNDSYGLVDDNDSGILLLEGNSTSAYVFNAIKIKNSASGGDPIIEAFGYDNNINVEIKSKNAGDVELDANTGNVTINSTNIDIAGYIKSSLYKALTSNPSRSVTTNWNIPISSDTILYDFRQSHSAGTYFSNITTGIVGQKLNLISNNSGNQSLTEIADFGENNLLCGSGTATKLKFQTTGQSATLIYLGFPINKWQILNTGCQTI